MGGDTVLQAIDTWPEERILCDEPPRTIVPPAFYRDDEPPEPPADDPHWQEFPGFDSLKGYHLLVGGIVGTVLFATIAHLLLLFTVAPQ